MKDISQTFIEKLHECNQHKKRLLGAKNRLKDYIPLSVERYNILDEVYISTIDQMIFRFSKLQDLLGSKIFRAYLESAGFVVEEKSFNELLKELEKEGDMQGKFQYYSFILKRYIKGDVNNRE